MNEARDQASFTFKVAPPALLLSNLPDGSTQIRIDGFVGHETRPGVPDLPFTIVRVALPPGATPRLILGSVIEDRIRGTVPRPVARLAASLAPDADLTARGEKQVRRERFLEPDPEIFKGRELYPRSIVTLGSVGMFRDQSYVEVVIAPARFDPVLQGLRVARSLTVTVAFDGDTGARANPSPDPRLEDLYRDMFVNYAQGTTFRASSAPASFAVSAAPQVGPRYRIRVRATGMVRLDSTRLAGTGFESQPLSSYKLMDRGVEVPLYVFDANTNDQLDAGDWVQFYGQALDDEPKTVLNTVFPGGTNIYELRDYSDENVYFLTTEPGARSRLTVRNAPPDLSPPAAKFDAVAHMETDNAFRPLGDNDPWYWAPSQSNPASGGASISRSLTSIALPGLASGTDPARVIVRLRGLSEEAGTFPDHKSRITLLNSFTQALAQNNDNGTFDGRAIYTHDFTWTYPGTGPVLTNPAQMNIDAVSVVAPPTYKNQLILDFVEFRYKRLFQAAGDVLTFDYPDGDAEFQITGLATNAPEVWEVTGRVGASPVVAPVRVTGGTSGGGAGNFSMRFHMSQDPAIPDGTPRRFVVAGQGAVTVPAAADFTLDTVSDLRDNANEADLIVIQHPTALGAGSTATLNSLLAWKLANQGIKSKIVAIQDVYDEFGDGLASAQAIKSFLAYTLSTNPGEGWAGRKPAWVLLIGDGSFDPKYNDTSVPASNLLPTQVLFKDDPSFGYYASDSILADVAGNDALPDLVVGRIPTRTDGQTNAVLLKIYAYEQNPLPGAWRENSVFVSDRGKEYSDTEALEWEATNKAGRDFLKIPPQTQTTLRYWTDYLCGPICSNVCPTSETACTFPAREALRTDIKSAVSAGASMVQYAGHGNFDVWSDDYFFAQNWNGFFDVNDLTNGGKLPWLIVHNCLTGGFENNVDSTLGEEWLKKQSGGALAVYAPSGLTDSYWGDEATKQIWGQLFGPRKERVLGTAAAAATNFICGYGAAQACQNYVLLGDPTTRLVFTSVAPATQVVATAGNHVVNLAWTASTTSGATYNILRAEGSPTANYAPVASDLGATNFADTLAQNATTYYYAVVAMDPAKFESRWSNFNSDCAVAGPDCVTARPLNPNPPAVPTGLVVTDPESGGKLTLSWTPNVETDFDHYTVKWGTTTGDHPSSGNALKKTTYTLAGLTNGQTYYIVLTATNTSGITSADSPEQPGRPTFVRGVRSPAFITTLKIGKSGANAVLTWAPVTTDIYGKPATVAMYEVYRGTTATFIPSPANRIGQPVTATFTDLGALSSANPNYHYLVRAVDTSGNVGGLGNPLPNGIDLLVMTKTPDGLGGYTLGFSWPAVTTDFVGGALPIHHYEVYGADHRFSRTDIRNNAVPLVGSPMTASFSVTAPAASQYYSVLAVDARGNKSSF